MMDSSYLLWSFILLLFHYLYRWVQKRKIIWDAIEPFGGEPWYPIIGTTLDIIKTPAKDFYDVYCRRQNMYGPVFRTYMGSHPALHIMKATDVEAVLSSTTSLSKGGFYRFITPFLGEGLIAVSNPKKWRHHRKLITPTFHFSVLDAMQLVMGEKSQILMDILKEKADGKFFNILPYITNVGLDVVCETAMGVQIHALTQPNSEYVKSISELADIAVYRMFHPYLHSDLVFHLSAKGRLQRKYLSTTLSFAHKVIAERKEKLSKGDIVELDLTEEDKLLGKKKRLAFLDLLLEANTKSNGNLTDKEIADEVVTFMFAGHDTTKTAVGWTLQALAQYPEHQVKVQKELDEIFGGQERPITPQDVGEMQYLDRVIKESMRLIPIVPAIGRTLHQNTVIGGRVIPAGVAIVIHLDNLHKDPEQFPNPEHFDPDRFLPENVNQRHPYSFLPFSAGPRNCIGQKFAMRNVKVMLAAILRKYNVKALKQINELKFYVELVMRPQGGLYIALEPRTQFYL